VLKSADNDQSFRSSSVFSQFPNHHLLALTIPVRLLVNRMPFTAADPLEWVHCHIARQPTPPSDRAGVLEPLSSLIMKLFAKNAEDR
jgi:hypothetical protein